MASSDDFKAAIKAGRLKEALVLAMGKSIELNITTWVSQRGDRPSLTRRSETAKPGYRLQTRINLMAGDIENEIGDRFIGNGPYSELREFHQQQVADSNKILQNNILSLQKLFSVLSSIQQQEGDVQISEQPLELSEPNSPLLPSSKPAPPSLTPAPPPSSESDWQDLGTVAETAPDVPDSEDWEGIVVDELEDFPPEAPPSPEMPVSELEIEDWERSTEGQGAIAPDDLELEEDIFPSEIAATEPSEDYLQGGEAIASPEPEADWDDFVEVPPPELEPPAALDEEEDWGDFAEVPAPELEPPAALDEEEDWGNLDEALDAPSASPDSGMADEEDWGDFAEVPAPELEPPAALNEEEDWGNLDEALDAPSASPDSGMADEEDWGDFAEVPAPELEPPAAEDIDLGDVELAEEEDWGDFEPEPTPDSNAPNLESLNLDKAEDWESDWIEEDVELASPEARTGSDSFGAEEEWEDFEALDPFATAPAEPTSTSDELEENWDDFAADELEPYPKLPEDDFSTTEPTGAIPMPPPASQDWESEEAEFGTEISPNPSASDDDLFEGLTAADARKLPEE